MTHDWKYNHFDWNIKWCQLTNPGSLCALNFVNAGFKDMNVGYDMLVLLFIIYLFDHSYAASPSPKTANVLPGAAVVLVADCNLEPMFQPGFLPTQ